MHTNPLASPRPLFTSDERATGSPVTFHFNDQKISVPGGTTVAAALLLNGVAPFRATPVKGAPRSAYCMMGVCFDCLVEVDGKPSRQACLTQVRDGMVVCLQQGASAIQATMEGENHGR